ncbi:hypothetical protein AEM51_13905 [Bacteroidetes bacterium UKL13-3]|nr:hypothetical protein AEM51_13905 [Bacteroidetes bacterium UKL13-3]
MNLQNYLIALVLFSIVSYKLKAQTTYWPPNTYYGPLHFWLLEGGGILVHCENLHGECATVYRPKRNDPWYDVFGQENIMIKLYDNPVTPKIPRTIVVRNTILVESQPNGGVTLTCQPPIN